MTFYEKNLERSFAGTLRKQRKCYLRPLFNFFASDLIVISFVIRNINYIDKAASKQEGPKKFGVPNKKAVLL